MGGDREPQPDFEHQLEHYLQGHVHPDVQPQVRHEIRQGHLSAEAFLRIADVLQANHDAFDRDLEIGQAVVGWSQEGEYIDSHAQVIERTPVAQQDFDRRRVDL